MIAQITSDTIKQVAFDGPITGSTALVLGIVAAIAMCLVLSLERHIVGRLWASFFGLLRCAALAAVCWMLLQPSLVERRTSVQTRSVAILVDRSGSMETVDKKLTSQMLPWIQRDHVETNAAERAAIDLRFAAALVRTNWLESATLATQAAEQVLKRFDVATVRCQEHLTQLIDVTSRPDPLVSQRAWAIRDEVRGATLDRNQLASETEASDRNRYADRIVETLQQQAADLESIVIKLQRDRTENPPEFTAKSRKEHVKQWLDQLESGKLQELPKSASIKRAIFDSSVHAFTGNDWSKQLSSDPTDANGDDESARTDLTAAVSWFGPTAVTDQLAAVFLVSEGGHNADSKLSPVAASRALGGVPVLGIGIGNSMRSRDLVLHRVNVPRVVVEDDDIKIEAIVSAYDCEESTAQIVLRQGAAEIERKTVYIDSSLSDTRLQFRVPAQSPGLREFQLAIEPIDGEVSEKNNYSAFSVETIRGKTRVLLADLQTRWEYRYLQILFARDRRVEADEFLRLPNPHATGQIAALGRLPESVEEWAHYDVVLLGDLDLNQASRDSLEEYVRQRAGKLIVIAGKNYMPASYQRGSFFDLLPIHSQQASNQPFDPIIEISPEGEMHPAMQIESTPSESRSRWWLASSRASMGYVSPWTVPRDSARVLATLQSASSSDVMADKSDQSAWLCWHRVGAGHVVYLTAPAVYKLRFRGGDTYHHRFWGQMLRWLMASDLASDKQLVHLRTDKSNYIQGDSVQVVAQLQTPHGFPEAGGEISVSVSASDGSQRIVALREDESLPGTYRADIRDLEPEVYQLKPVGRTVQRLQSESPDSDPAHALITVEQIGDIEHMLTSANYPLMADIAAATGGHLLTPAAAEEAFSLLPLEEQVKTIEDRTPIWNRWPLLWLIAGCLSTEWIVRKMKGLV